MVSINIPRYDTHEGSGVTSEIFQGLILKDFEVKHQFKEDNNCDSAMQQG